MGFSTFDRDNDGTWRKCAAKYGGGHWWHDCGHDNINGQYGNKWSEGLQFMYWQDFDDGKPLKSMALMFK